jgi:hypothetical protein
MEYPLWGDIILAKIAKKVKDYEKKVVYHFEVGNP